MPLKKVVSSKWGAFFIILPYIKPASEITGGFDTIFDLWKLLSALIIIIVCIEQIKKYTLSLIAILSIQIVFLLSTLINLGDLKTAVVQVLSNISISLYAYYCCKYGGKDAIKNFAFPIMCMAVLTALTMFIYYPDGMYSVTDKGRSIHTESSNFLWGFDNSSVFNFIPGMMYWGVYSLLENKKKLHVVTLFLYLFIFSAFLYVGAITAFIACFVIAFSYLLIAYRKNGIKIMNARNSIIVILVMAFMLFVIGDGLVYLMDFAKSTGKFYSVKARFIFWNHVIDEWHKSFIFGYGIEAKDVIRKKLIIDHPHNYFMDIIYRGGFLALVCVAVYYFKLLNSHIKNTRTASFASICFLAMMIVSQMDFYTDKYLFYPVIILTICSINLEDSSEIRLDDKK